MNTNQIGAAVTAIVLLILVAFMAPNILALNRGKVLRNIAMWLAIFAGLGLAYSLVGWKVQSTRWNYKEPKIYEEKQLSPSASPGDGKDTNNLSFTPPGD